MLESGFGSRNERATKNNAQKYFLLTALTTLYVCASVRMYVCVHCIGRCKIEAYIDVILDVRWYSASPGGARNHSHHENDLQH